MYVYVGGLLEKDMLLFYGHSASQGDSQVRFPEIPRGFTADRMELKHLRGVIRLVLDRPSASQISMIVNVDPKIQHIPRPIMNFVSRFIFGILLHLMNKHGQMIRKDPYNNIHAIRMREHPNYYHNALLRWIRNCRDNAKAPRPYIAALEVDLDCEGTRHYQELIKKYGVERRMPHGKEKKHE